MNEILPSELTGRTAGLLDRPGETPAQRRGEMEDAKKEMAQAKKDLLEAKDKLKELSAKLREISEVMEKIEAAQDRLQKVEEKLFLDGFSKKSYFRPIGTDKD